MITNETVLLYTLKYPHLAQLEVDEIKALIHAYKEWLLEDPDWLAEHGGDANSIEHFELYLECLQEDEKFIKEQMEYWRDEDDVPGFR